MREERRRPAQDHEDYGSVSRQRVLSLLREHGWNATSFQVLEPGYRYWFAPEGDACVAYVDLGGAWVAAGAPIASEGRLGAVASEFVAAARAARKRATFFGVEARFCELVDLPSLKVGEQPYWDPAAWPAPLAGSRSLREQLRRARAKGVAVRRVDPSELEPAGSLRAEVTRLASHWLATRPMAPMGFLVDLEPFLHAEERRYFAAEQGGALVAFLAAVPIYGRRGWLIEDLLRYADAPNGTTELLIDAAMRSLADEGATFVTLGMVPLAGVSGWLAAVRDRTRRLYDFRGLDEFKQRLRPVGRGAIHLAHAPEVRPLQAVLDALKAFARGSLLRFGVHTMLRGGSPVLTALAVALVPWTCLLALAPGGLFPSPGIQAAWVAFDVVLAVALFALARRYRPRLGMLLTAVVAGDTLLTWAQAALWNAPRVADWGTALAVVVAAIAPAVGATILWGALRRERRARRRGVAVEGALADG